MTETTTETRHTEVTRFWRHLFGGQRGLIQVWTGVRDEDGKVPEETIKASYFNYPNADKSAAEWALEKADEGREVYFCAHLLTEARRIKENASEVITLWGDLDDAPVPNGNLSPSAVIESSLGRYHAYWRLTDALPPETAEKFNRRIAHATGADPSGFDLTQLLRVPGTTNRKYAEQPTVTVHSLEASRIYTPAELDAALPVLRKKETAPPVDEQIPDGHRNSTLTSLAGTMRRRGMDEEEITAALKVANRRRCNPPLEDEEVRKIAHSVSGYEPADEGVRISVSGRRIGGESEHFNLTDLGNSARLIARHGNDLRYCYPWGKWLIWDGQRWKTDDTGEVHRRAKDTVSGIYQEAASTPDEETRKALAKHAMRSEAENKIQAMINLAKSEVPIIPTQLDASPWLLNCKNGTIDLRTGERREHQREDLVTKLAPVEYNPSAIAPTWLRTLERVLPQLAVRTFFKKLCGSAISGDVSEHILPVLYGTGANGKSTILNALLEAVGEYGMQAAPDLLIAKRGGHPTEVADLFGMRVVASIEVEDGRRLAEALVKSLTGGDKVRARRMRQDFWEFDPTHTAFLCTNHKPEIRGTDSGIWRRIRLIPFTETLGPAEQDKKLPVKLRAEMAGILAWAVEGCLEWQSEGLHAPEEVRKATGQYRLEMDVIGAFLRDECESDPEHKASFKDVYERYELWCEQGGERAETRRKFNARLKERGQFVDRRSGPGGSYEWHGLRLLKKQNSGFAGKLKEHSKNDYNQLDAEPTRDDRQDNFSSSVTSVESSENEPANQGQVDLQDLFQADEEGAE